MKVRMKIENTARSSDESEDAAICYQIWNHNTSKVYENKNIVFLKGVYVLRIEGELSIMVKNHDEDSMATHEDLTSSKMVKEENKSSWLIRLV